MNKNIEKLLKDYLQRNNNDDVSDIFFYPTIESMHLRGTYRCNGKTFPILIDVLDVIAFAYSKINKNDNNTTTL